MTLQKNLLTLTLGKVSLRLLILKAKDSFESNNLASGKNLVSNISPLVLIICDLSVSQLNQLIEVLPYAKNLGVKYKCI